MQNEELKDSIVSFLNSMGANIGNTKFDSHKVIMLGGKRAGKSVILASILHQIRESEPVIHEKTGLTCSIVDTTDYTNGAEPLDVKQAEIESFCKKPSIFNFLVSTGDTIKKSEYDVTLKMGTKTSITFTFVDVPGERMRKNDKNHNDLLNDMQSTDVYVVAIDTPYLMQSDESINKKYNRSVEISDLLKQIQLKSEIDKRFVILCPVKCEKWINEGKCNEVIEATKRTYDSLIRHYQEESRMKIVIMPILTAGGLEHSELTESQVLVRGNERIRCTKNPYMDLARTEKGDEIKLEKGEVPTVNEDFNIDHVQMPYSWYKTNGKGYAPHLCEQPFFYIMRFLVNKEVEHLEYVKSQMSFFKRLAEDNLVSTFTESLPFFQDFVKRIESSGIIKKVKE